MKKSVFLLIFLVACSLMTTVAQSNKVPTSSEEYNYVTKGYQIQISSGLDMKIGYSVIDLGTKNCYNRNIKISKLMRQIGDNLHLCATMVYFNGGGVDTYLCLPTINSGSDIWNAYWRSLESFRTLSGCDNYRALLCAISIYASESSN